MIGKLCFLLSLLVFYSTEVKSCTGCVGLDEITFEKVVPKFSAVLVKFDVAFPYGEKHEIYGKLAKETAQSKNLLLAEIGVKDYGEKENEKLALKYGVSKDDYPAVKLFKKDLEKPVNFPKDSEFTIDNLRGFVRDNTNIYLGLPGCMESFDKLAKEFLEAKDKAAVVNKGEELKKKLNEKDSIKAKTYLLIMKRIIENGAKFIETETGRVTKLLKSKLTDKKQQEIQEKLNVLRAFSVTIKDEL